MLPEAEPSTQLPAQSHRLSMELARLLPLLASLQSLPRPVSPAGPLPTPQLTVSPQHLVYLPREAVNLTCSAAGAPTLSGIRFFRNSGEILCIELPSPQPRFTSSLDVSDVSGPQAGGYSCESWRKESGKEITSQRSRVIAIAVVDPPPQPELSVDPPSGVVNEGFSLNITCTAPGDPRERRFHFFKDRADLLPGDLGSEISTMEPSTGSVKVSAVSIRPKITGEFTCGYEEIVGGRWALSPPSQAVNVTVNTSTVSHSTHDIVLTTGGVLLLHGVLAALLC